LNCPDLRPDQIAALIPDLTRLVARACGAIRGCSGLSVRSKADGSPVTDADEAVEAVILDGLAKLLPELPVVAEERVASQAPPPLGGTFVLVDPLDGTKEFIAGRDEYTVNLGIVSNSAPVAGIIAAPAQRRLWRGVVGFGAERLALAGGDFGAVENIHTRAWPSAGAVALVSRSHRDPATQPLLSRLPVAATESCGSSLKFCRVAEGSADVYPRFGSTSEWDIAAGHALVVAAGGAVAAPDGRPLAYGRSETNFRVPGFIAWGDPSKVGSV